jgi:hypothetical protein
MRYIGIQRGAETAHRVNSRSAFGIVPEWMRGRALVLVEMMAERGLSLAHALKEVPVGHGDSALGEGSGDALYAGVRQTRLTASANDMADRRSVGALRTRQPGAPGLFGAFAHRGLFELAF